MATIRHAEPGDASAIAGLWNHIIRDTLVTFNSSEKPEAEVSGLIATRPGAFLVAEEAGEFLGFATFAQFRAGPGYAHTQEHTILLAPAAQRRGLGRRLMARLCDAARARGAHVLVAAISAANPEGLAFHAALGFREVARMPEVGRKFDAWHELVLMQRPL
ncbi:MAG TPA: GNAT family N-acetyltransferase [Allosphingosinicella sp.]|nr:GNAT family N-acetyltransferase [Allosphingosinicella sp.]